MGSPLPSAPPSDSAAFSSSAPAMTNAMERSERHPMSSSHWSIMAAEPSPTAKRAKWVAGAGAAAPANWHASASMDPASVQRVGAM